MPAVTDILNWRRVDDHITTSGQPSEEELALLRDDGVTTIINLGPHSNDGALPDEPGSVAALGMAYVYIPVDFDAPTTKDFEDFQAALKKAAGQRLHVHCIYNARVSAFFYRLAKGSDLEPSAFERMDGIWRPGGVWADFIGKLEDAGLPNRFLGYDY